MVNNTTTTKYPQLKSQWWIRGKNKNGNEHN